MESETKFLICFRPFGGEHSSRPFCWEDFSTCYVDYKEVLMIEWSLLSIGPPFLATCISENPHTKTEPEAILGGSSQFVSG